MSILSWRPLVIIVISSLLIVGCAAQKNRTWVRFFPNNSSEQASKDFKICKIGTNYHDASGAVLSCKSASKNAINDATLAGALGGQIPLSPPPSCREAKLALEDEFDKITLCMEDKNWLAITKYGIPTALPLDEFCKKYSKYSPGQDDCK